MTMPTPEASSAFAPFRQRIFTVLWGATLISNIGTWMFNVTSGWLMTDLSPSPLMVSLVQVAASLPVFLFALPAGALGDIFDRRKVLMITQAASVLIMFAFAGLLWSGQGSAWLLLVFTFLTGAGAAFSTPAFQAVTPQLVSSKKELPAAIALNSVSVNIARAIGPALGGFILAAVGAVATVMLNGLSFITVLAALLWWQSKSDTGSGLPREHMVGAMQAGVRFALRSRALRYTIVRALAFFTFASAYWALLPLVARDLLQGGPSLYGVLLTALGAGAVGGTFLLPALKRYFNMNVMVAFGTVGTALALALFAYGGTPVSGIVAGVIAGVSWITVVSALNVSAQFSLPDWVRARGLAIFQMMFFGAMTAGSLIWGQMASSAGLSQTLATSAVLALAGIAVTWRCKLNLDEREDYSPSGHWPEPVLLTPVSNDRGPVLVTLEYHIADNDRTAFTRLIRQLGNVRRRDGATQWGYFEDVKKKGHFIEAFFVESWAAHLRQHSRVSHADKTLQDKINALHQGAAHPHVTHAVTPDLHEQSSPPLPKGHRD